MNRHPNRHPNWHPREVPRLPGPFWCLPLAPPTTRLNRRPRPQPRTGARKPVEVRSLYPKPVPELVQHAHALLEHVKTWSPEMIGEYVWQSDLKGTYHELCEVEGWEPRHWTGIGRELGKITKKIEPKRNGKKSVAYRIPTAIGAHRRPLFS